MSTSKAARLVPQTQQGVEEFVHVSSFAIIKDGGKVLLAKRLRPENQAGKLAIPSSVINYGEDPEAAVKRIVKDQLGAAATSAKLIDVQSYGDKHWDICFVYEVAIPGLGTLHADIEKADYYALTSIPPEIRQDHLEVIDTLKQRMRV